MPYERRRFRQRVAMAPSGGHGPTSSRPGRCRRRRRRRRGCFSRFLSLQTAAGNRGVSRLVQRLREEAGDPQLRHLLRRPSPSKLPVTGGTSAHGSGRQHGRLPVVQRKTAIQTFNGVLSDIANLLEPNSALARIVAQLATINGLAGDNADVPAEGEPLADDRKLDLLDGQSHGVHSPAALRDGDFTISFDPGRWLRARPRVEPAPLE